MQSSHVHLYVVREGQKTELGVKASRSFGKGEYIYELVGHIPIDSLAEHTELSVIEPHVDQGEVLERRVFFGPIRFINHHCKLYNVQVSKCHS